MIKIFNFGVGLTAGIKEDTCDNCMVRKAVILYQNREGLLCFQCIAAFFSDAIPVPLRDKEKADGFDEESTQIMGTLHDFILHPGQRPWNRLEDSERLEKLRMADRLLPMLRKYFKR
jgi:hypothetical protein